MNQVISKEKVLPPSLDTEKNISWINTQKRHVAHRITKFYLNFLRIPRRINANFSRDIIRNIWNRYYFTTNVTSYWDNFRTYLWKKNADRAIVHGSTNPLLQFWKGSSLLNYLLIRIIPLVRSVIWFWKDYEWGLILINPDYSKQTIDKHQTMLLHRHLVSECTDYIWAVLDKHVRQMSTAIKSLNNLNIREQIDFLCEGKFCDSCDKRRPWWLISSRSIEGNFSEKIMRYFTIKENVRRWIAISRKSTNNMVCFNKDIGEHLHSSIRPMNNST